MGRKKEYIERLPPTSSEQNREKKNTTQIMIKFKEKVVISRWYQNKEKDLKIKKNILKPQNKEKVVISRWYHKQLLRTNTKNTKKKSRWYHKQFLRTNTKNTKKKVVGISIRL